MSSTAEKPAAKAKAPSRFRLPATSIGLIAGAVGVGATLLYMQQFEEHATGGRKIAVLATAQAITRGSVINDGMLAAREVPQAYLDDRAVRVADKARIIGLRATNNIAVGQTVQWTDTIAVSDDQRDLASLVQPGNRALPLKVTNDESLALTRPGDFVDILSVINGESTVLMQRVLVLAIGLNTRSDARQLGASTITVSVGIAEGQLLTLAMEKGRLTVVVRNPNDQHLAETLPAVNDSALIDPSKRRELRRGTATRGNLPVRLESE
jgi:pilus assembly protein CpaB